MKARNNRTGRDLVVIAAVAVVSLVLAMIFDFYENFFSLADNFERYEVDEVISALPTVLALALGIFALRRWRESRLANRDLEDLNVRLEDQAEELRQHAAELSRANQSLKEKNEENEMFVYSVSHDLRSPLVNLEGFSRELEMVGEDLRELLAGDAVTPEVREKGFELLDEDADSLRFIRTGVARLSSIIDALLRLSRAGRVEYRWQEVDVGDTVVRVLDAMRATVEERGAKVEVRELPPAWGDVTAIEQIFANLISNALKYLDQERPGLLEVGSEDPRDGERGGFSVYYVRDNGSGIPEQYRGKVFQIFQRFHAETEGEGLGLALVRRMVERHGGSIWFESAEGGGSAFYVELPAAEMEAVSLGTEKIGWES